MLSKSPKAVHLAHDGMQHQAGLGDSSVVCRVAEAACLDTEGVSWCGYKAPVEVLKALHAWGRTSLRACEACPNDNEPPLSSSVSQSCMQHHQQWRTASTQICPRCLLRTSLRCTGFWSVVFQATARKLKSETHSGSVSVPRNTTAMSRLPPTGAEMATYPAASENKISYQNVGVPD